jgi:hypothetical protein
MLARFRETIARAVFDTPSVIFGFRETVRLELSLWISKGTRCGTDARVNRMYIDERE